MSLEPRKPSRMTDSTELAEVRQRVTDLENKLAVLEQDFAAELASIVRSIERITDRTRDFMAGTAAALDRMAAEIRGEREH